MSIDYKDGLVHVLACGDVNTPPQGAERAPRRVASAAGGRALLDRVPRWVERHANVSWRRGPQHGDLLV
jgi:hypothetical protein